MTKNEKKTSHSEITLQKPSYIGGTLIDSSFQLQYTILEGQDALDYQSPLDGFVHIIVIEGCWSGTYLLDNKPYIIRCCENVIHTFRKNSQFQWKNASDDTVVLLLFVPKVMFADLIVKEGYSPQQLEEGLVSKNSQRLSLITNRLYELSRQKGLLQHTLQLQILLMETLLCQTQNLCTGGVQDVANGNKNYYDKVLLVKKIIESDLSKNYTITELAKEVGTNEQYIKKYFKQYFGKTVMNYVTSSKMEYAKGLIMTGEYRISDVARMTGYKHSTHFTTAFKKYFGFIPNSLRYTFLIAQGGLHFLREYQEFIGVLSV
ncbi:MAG TPA: helix-turn-helix transcriptional regulator [Sphingobacterium sp.]|nr:helix-turn-helix transcriptional regulator [Sphingobacterium sp.]